jgi:hypothetical protein
MNEATLELARAAVASPHWRWMPGMRIAYANSDEAFRVCGEPAYVDGLYHAHGIPEDWEAAPDDELPDFDDPATSGCLLALVREAWGAPDFYPELTNVGWRVFPDSALYPTEAAALVAALLAAPPREVER